MSAASSASSSPCARRCAAARAPSAEADTRPRPATPIDTRDTTRHTGQGMDTWRPRAEEAEEEELCFHLDLPLLLLLPPRLRLRLAMEAACLSLRCCSCTLASCACATLRTCLRCSAHTLSLKISSGSPSACATAFPQHSAPLRRPHGTW